jgi:hypothetical protein
MRFSLKRDGAPLAWPLTDVDLATVVVIDMHRPLGPQALRAAIVRRSRVEIGPRSTLLAAALTAAALGLAAVSYLA